MQTRISVRVVCTRAYHALFMHNMMIRPSAEELANFGEPDFTIYNAGALLPCTPPAAILWHGGNAGAGISTRLHRCEHHGSLKAWYQMMQQSSLVL